MPQFRVPTFVSFAGDMGEPLEFSSVYNAGDLREEVGQESRSQGSDEMIGQAIDGDA